MSDTAIARIDNMLKGNFDFADQKISTAYALNLCTVSVSQIIDYQDLMILEHEYDAILNNLNIEKLPDDEALLAILKQLLDTITFFRIQEVEKDFVDREYQNQMKNAIWNAVPNMGLIIAGANPLTLAFSLASQIGVGYMNYRKNKADNMFAHEKAKWQLQRAAIEQFNGLRRELFDTAWRLINAHNIPDEYRLTERQVKQYNTILMDTDIKRKYERLDTIKEHFVAYPPFWYFFGNTANAFSQKSEGERAGLYKEKAKQYFEIFIRSFSACNLLRENQVASACALEYIDLLDVRKPEEKQKILELIQFAVKMSGNANDVLQLCAFAYLKAGDSYQAAKLFRRLVNEEYNTVVNAQLLSSYYVSAWLSGNNIARDEYEDLKDRVDQRYLYPFPDKRPKLKDVYYSLKDCQDGFAENQKEILCRKYILVLEQFKDKYQILFNHCVPHPEGSIMDDGYYDGSQQACELRKEAGEYLKDQQIAEDYSASLYEVGYPANCLEVLNSMLNDINSLTCTQGQETQLQEMVRSGVLKYKVRFRELMDLLDVHRPVTTEDYQKIQDISFNRITDKFFKQLTETAISYVEQKTSIIDLNDAETNLREFCQQEGFCTPEVIFDTANDLVETQPVSEKYIKLELITNGYVSKKMDGSYETVKDIILYKKESICKSSSSVRMLMNTEEAFDRYFARLEIPNKADIRRKTIAVLDDMTAKDNDLIFTTDGVMQVVRGKMQKPMPYNDVYFSLSGETILLNQPYYSSDVNMEELKQLFLKLRTEPYVEKKEKKMGFWIRK